MQLFPVTVITALWPWRPQCSNKLGGKEIFPGARKSQLKQLQTRWHSKKVSGRKIRTRNSSVPMHHLLQSQRCFKAMRAACTPSRAVQGCVPLQQRMGFAVLLCVFEFPAKEALLKPQMVFMRDLTTILVTSCTQNISNDQYMLHCDSLCVELTQKVVPEWIFTPYLEAREPTNARLIFMLLSAACSHPCPSVPSPANCPIGWTVPCRSGHTGSVLRRHSYRSNATLANLLGIKQLEGRIKVPVKCYRFVMHHSIVLLRPWGLSVTSPAATASIWIMGHDSQGRDLAPCQGLFVL